MAVVEVLFKNSISDMIELVNSSYTLYTYIMTSGCARKGDG